MSTHNTCFQNFSDEKSTLSVAMFICQILQWNLVKLFVMNTTCMQFDQITGCKQET